MPFERTLKFVRPVPRTLREVDRIKAMWLGLPIKKANQKIPFGYMQHQVIEDALYPIDEELRLLYRAVQYYKRGKSVQEILDWIEYETGKKIDVPVFYQILKTRTPGKEVLLPLEEREKLFFTRNDF